MTLLRCHHEIDREASRVENGKTLEPFNRASIQMINRTLDCQGTKHITGVNTNCPLETDQNQLTPAWKDMKFRGKNNSCPNWLLHGGSSRCSTSVGFSTLSPPTLQWSGSCAKVPGFFQNHGNNSLRRFYESYHPWFREACRWKYILEVYPLHKWVTTMVNFGAKGFLLLTWSFEKLIDNYQVGKINKAPPGHSVKVSQKGRTIFFRHVQYISHLFIILSGNLHISSPHFCRSKHLQRRPHSSSTCTMTTLATATAAARCPRTAGGNSTHGKELHILKHQETHQETRLHGWDWWKAMKSDASDHPIITIIRSNHALQIKGFSPQQWISWLASTDQPSTRLLRSVACGLCVVSFVHAKLGHRLSHAWSWCFQHEIPKIKSSNCSTKKLSRYKNRWITPAKFTHFYHPRIAAFTAFTPRYQRP